MNAIMGALNQVKLTVQQWGLIMGAAAVGGLALLLKVRTEQLHTAQIGLLKSHHENELAIVNMKQAANDARAKQSGERFDDAINAYTARYGKPPFPSEPGDWRPAA